MRKAILFVGIFCLALAAIAGFKPKVVKSKKPEQFQTRKTLGGVTVAADLLLDGENQRKIFYRELTPNNVIAVRLAIFNNSQNEVLIPLEGIQLMDPSGEAIPASSPELVAQAVLQGFVVHTEAAQRPVQVLAGDPRIDRTRPGYDPRLDPTSPDYDPTDPRNRTYGGEPRNTASWPGRGVDVILNPDAGENSKSSAQLIERDFINKAYSSDPVVPSLYRDKFLYFALENLPSSSRGFALRLPKGKGIPEAIILKF